MIAASHQTTIAVQNLYHGVQLTQDTVYELNESPFPRSTEQVHRCADDDDDHAQDLSCLRRSSTARENSEAGPESSNISAYRSELSSSPTSSSPSPSSCSSPSLRPTLASTGSQSEKLVAMREILDRLQAHQQESETGEVDDDLSLSDDFQENHDHPTLNPEILRDALGQRSLRQRHGDANLHH